LHVPLDLKNNLARMPWGQELDDAVKQALRDMIKLICEIRGRSPQDAYTLSSKPGP
jgi:acetamidase/formamidase